MAVMRPSRLLWVVSGSLLLTFALAATASTASLGILTQVAGQTGCVKEVPVAGDCADGTALNGARSVAVSPDGKYVYVVSASALAIFARLDATGGLGQYPGLRAV